MYDENGGPSEGLVMDWEEHNAHVDGTDGIEPDFDEPVTLTLRLTAYMADQLWTARMATFVRDQADRFEEIEPGFDVLDERWVGGGMSWCATASDAILLAAYEGACGFDAILLWDTVNAMRGEDAYVVLSTRPCE